MPIPLSIILCDRGANGVPTTNNPVNLAGRVESYEDTTDDRYGFATARVSWTPTRAEILEWARADHLLRPMTAYTPDARVAWDGFLAEIEIELGTKKIAFSLKDMANRLTVRYSTPTGGQADSATYSNTASQALFGVKDRVINASVAASAAAGNQAQTILSVLAFPRSKQPSSAGTPRGALKITLTFWGYYALLDWLLTSSTSTTTTATSTQVVNLLTSYNSTNNVFSTSTTNIVITGIADTEYTEPDTTYREKIERLLARGTSSQQLLSWGIYEGRALTVAVRASATPDVITYYESEASGQIRDAWQNVVDPWDVRPNAMALITDLIDAPIVGAAESPLRKYVAKVRRSVRGSDVSVSLDPDDVESLESLLTSPAGGGPAGTSDRQAAFERKVVGPARSVFPATDNRNQYDGGTGVWKPQAGGTGIINTGTIDTGGGNIGNSGGGNIDLGSGSGIGGAGSTGVSTAGGTAGRIAQWQTTSKLEAASLIKSSAGVLTLDAGSSMTVDFDGSTGQVLQKTSGGWAAATLSTADISGGLDGTGTAGRVAQWSDADTLAAATLIKSGAGVLTLSAGSAATLTIDSTTRLDGAGAASGQALIYNGTAYAPADVGSVTGTGTSGRVAQWSSSTALTSATLIKSGAGVLTLSAGSAATLTIDSTTRLDGSGAASGDVLTWNGTAYAPASASGVTGSGAANRVAYWSGTSALTSDSAMTWDATNNRLTVGEIITTLGTRWDLGSAAAAADRACNYLITVKLGGVTYYLLASDGGN